MFRRFGLLLLAALALARASASLAPDPGPSALTPQEIAQGYRDRVILARPLASRRAAAVADESREGVRVRAVFPRLGDIRVIELADDDTPADAIARLRATGRYEFVEPDYIRHLAVEPNDPRFTDGSLWQLKNTGASNGVVGADIRAPDAWGILHDAPGVVVAVVDTGLNLSHTDIAANVWTNPSPGSFSDLHGANFVGGRGNLVSGNPADDNGHGSHVAGTIGAIGNNGVAVAGVAWNVQLMPVKVFGSSGSAPISEIAAGINYAVTHGAHIINASYGESGSTGFSATEFAAIAAARDAGIVFVAAAGNSAVNMDVTRFYPASHALDNIVTVGNSTRRDELALSSNYGAAVDLFAPGSEIVSLDYSSSTGTAVMTGTSMSAPHVAGALALLKARFPADNYRQLINRVLRGAEAGRNPNPAVTFVGKCQTGGRLNLFNALSTTSNRPFNDDFAARPRLSSDNLAVRASNAGATAETSEPTHAGATATASIWWEWTAPVSGTVSLDTAGSAYDTVLAVYTAANASSLTAPTGLTPVASNDDAPGLTTSRVSFSATAGVTYEFAVDRKGGASGLTLLNLGTSPANDTFATPVVLSGASTRVTGSTAHCSRELGEPLILGYSGGTSVWYRWTAPRTGRFQVAVVTADFDPIVGIYTGGTLASLANLSAVAGSTANGAVCSLDAVSGTTYSIALDAKSAATSGAFTLTLVDSLWQMPTGSNVTGTAAVAPNGNVYVGSTDNSVYAFSADGTQLWSYATGGLIDTCSPAIADDGSVYVGSNDGKLYAFTAGGTLKWTHNFGVAYPVSNSPAIAADGTIYIKAGDGFLYALNPATGVTKWSRNLAATQTYGSPTVAPDGTIYQGSDNNKLYALNPADGSEKWSFTADNAIYAAPAIDAAGNIYFAVLTSGRLYSLTSAGALRWTYTGGAIGASSSPALSPDGATVYYGGYDSKLHAVNTATGAARWVYPLGAEVRASSPAVDAAGTIYIGCYDYKLYALNPDGSLNRTWDTANWIRSSPTLAGNRLYIGSNDHKLYAFALAAGESTGAWPQYRQNARHLGRVVSSTPTAPSISTPPASQTVTVGASVTFSVAVTGTAPFTYVWRKNTHPIPGAATATLSLTNVTTADAASYDVVVTNSVSSATSAAAVLTVNKAAASITLGSLAPTYDAAPHAATVTTSPVGLAVTLTYDDSPTAPTNAGSYAVAATIVDADYSGTANATLVIAKAPLTATANDKTKTQGAANPPLTISYSGFVAGESASVLDAPPTATTTATLASPAGTYPIALTGGSDNNYAFTLVAGTLTITAAPVAPSISSPPASRSAAQGESIVLTVTATGGTPSTIQWLRDGRALAGETSATLSLLNLQPAAAGLYFAAATNTGGTTLSTPAIVGLLTADKVLGAGAELTPHDIRHPNGNYYDQVLLQGPAATITADAGQVTRLSFIDLTDDIVQVEFSGPGSLTLVLENPTGPAPAVNYAQPAVSYYKGHARLVIVGANENTNVSVFSVGRLTAYDPSGGFNFLLPISSSNDPARNGNPIFAGHTSTAYDGVADIASIAILTTNGKFGGVRTANAAYLATAGYTGLYAPGVQFTGPVFLGDLTASDAAIPVILLGSAATTQINGGSLLQLNAAPIRVSGLTQLKFVAGITSHGVALPAQQNRAILRDPAGADVTTPIVVNPP